MMHGMNIAYMQSLSLIFSFIWEGYQLVELWNMLNVSIFKKDIASTEIEKIQKLKGEKRVWSARKCVSIQKRITYQ